jgi:hypothetical protein
MPPIESEADRASFFDDAETANIRGVDVPGQFDERTEFIDGVGPVPLQTTDPVFICQSVNVPSDITEGEPIDITRQDGTAFLGTVITHEPDGFGMTTLTLQDNG